MSFASCFRMAALLDMDIDNPNEEMAGKALDFTNNALVNGKGNMNLQCIPEVVQKLLQARGCPATSHQAWTDKTADNLRRIVEVAAVGRTLKFGNCDEFACVGFMYVYYQGAACEFLHWPAGAGDHCFIKVGSDKTAWILDAWNNDVYPIDQLPKKMLDLVGQRTPPMSKIALPPKHCERNGNFVAEYEKRMIQKMRNGKIYGVPDFATMSPEEQRKALEDLFA